MSVLLGKGLGPRCLHYDVRALKIVIFRVCVRVPSRSVLCTAATRFIKLARNSR